MYFKAITVVFCLLAPLVAAKADVAANPVDACNGHNHYGVGHSCAWGNSQGTCRTNSCGVLVCVAN